MFAHPKSPEAKDNDDEVDDISEEHESVDISGSSILSIHNIFEEALCGLVHSLDPTQDTALF